MENDKHCVRKGNFLDQPEFNPKTDVLCISGQLAGRSDILGTGANNPAIAD